MSKIVRGRAVASAIVTGLIIAAMALIGAGRFPVAFALVGIAWAAVTTVAVVHASRREA